MVGERNETKGCQQGWAAHRCEQAAGITNWGDRLVQKGTCSSSCSKRLEQQHSAIGMQQPTAEWPSGQQTGTAAQLAGSS